MLNAFLQFLTTDVVCTRGNKATINQAVGADNSSIGLGCLVLQPFPNAVRVTVFFVAGNIFFWRQDNCT